MKRLLISVLVIMMTVSVLPCGGAYFASTAKAAETAAAETMASQDDSSQQGDISDIERTVSDEQKTHSTRITLKLKRKDHIDVTGLRLKNNAIKTTKIKDTVRVSGAKGKTLKLQKMGSDGEWDTVRSYPVTSDRDAKVVLRYPNRAKTYSFWRVHIDGDRETHSYNSDEITVVSRNVSKLKLNARSACIYCMDTGEIIYGKNMDKRLPMASTTKIMTAVVVMENMSMYKKARISKRAARTPYRNLYMKRGDRYYVKDLFKAMMISSSNDAARALAENTAGSSRKFVKKMNIKAKELGLTKTRYTDEVGFGSRKHRSSARDLARLMTYAYQSDVFRNSINKKRYKFRNAKRTKKHRVVSSSYPMYRFSKNYLGGKTGTTNAARCCFVAVYRYGGRTYVCVNLGSRNNFCRWRDSKRMYRYIKKYGRQGQGALGNLVNEEPESDLYYEEVVEPVDTEGTAGGDEEGNGIAGENGEGGNGYVIPGSDEGSEGGEGGEGGEANSGGGFHYVIPGSDEGNGEVLSVGV